MLRSAMAFAKRLDGEASQNLLILICVVPTVASAALAIGLFVAHIKRYPSLHLFEFRTFKTGARYRIALRTARQIAIFAAALFVAAHPACAQQVSNDPPQSKRGKAFPKAGHGPAFPQSEHGPAFPQSVAPVVPYDAGASRSSLPDNLCGSSNGAALKSSPADNLCSTGVASVVEGSGPWHWKCSKDSITQSCWASQFTAEAAEKPGPSASVFAAPFYKCKRNFYVSTSGNDGAAGTPAAPWRTIQHADNAAGGRVAGDCVNVGPGIYSSGLRATHGGNAATPDGYVVYRCQILNGCKITSSGGVAAPSGLTIVSTGSGPNFLVIDGFELAANQQVTYGVGIMIFDGGDRSHPNTSHHIWLINNIIHGFGQSGIDIGSGEYFYVLHNLSYDNSGVTCDAQGSGIGIVVPKVFADFQPTKADVGFAPFHNVVAWNVAHDNRLTKCGTAADPYNTDGNGIIMDTFNGAGSNNTPYPYQTLVAFNVTYRNGAKGIHVFRASNVTVANNTAYDDNLDPFNRGMARGEIDISGGQNNLVISNVAYPIPASSTQDPRCQGTSPCYLRTNVAFVGGSNAGVTNANNRWSNNINFGGSVLFGAGPQGNVMLGNDMMNCAAGVNSNKCNVDPKLISPVDGNFALMAVSPAIGYGLAQNYLSAQSLDAGACDRSLSACP